MIGSVPASPVSYDPPPPPLHFVGREKQLAVLHDWMGQGAIGTLAVVGPAGIGKSTLVQQYVRQRKKKTFWVEASRIRALGEDLGSLILDVLKFQEQKNPDLIVIDGIDETDNISSYTAQIVAVSGLYSSIVTSRHLRREVSYLPTLHLEGLTERESFKLLSTRAPKWVKSRELRSLAAKVQGHPLALLFIAQLLNDYTVEQIELQLEGDWNDLLFKLPSGEN
jgi:hypothetical protein